MWVDATEGWLVLSRDAAVAAMRDASTFTVDDPRFTTGRVVGPSMLSLDGDEHRRHRQPFVGAYRARSLGPLAAFCVGEAHRRLDALAADGHAELRTAFAAPFATSVIHRSLEIADTTPTQLLAWYRDIVDSVSALSAGQPARTAGSAAMDALRDAVTTTVVDAPGSLLGRIDASALSPDEVAQNAAIVLFGAIETVEGMIANLFHHVLSQPGLLGDVADDEELLETAIEESLRLEPAASVVDRYATADVEFAGARIAAGDLVRISLAGANRDPAVYPDPDRFDPGRPNAGTQLAFAVGPHACIGAHLARIEAAAALAALTRALPGVRLAAEATPPSGLIFRKPDRLAVDWDAPD